MVDQTARVNLWLKLSWDKVKNRNAFAPIMPSSLILRDSNVTLQAMATRRRPRSLMNSAIFYNEKKDDGTWISREYHKASWVLMHPSTRGAFRQKKNAKYTYRSYWKGRIIDFKVSPGGQTISEVLVQHVYMHSELNVDAVNPCDFRKCNCKYGNILIHYLSFLCNCMCE